MDRNTGNFINKSYLKLPNVASLIFKNRTTPKGSKYWEAQAVV
jgi:hypothetical protein